MKANRSSFPSDDFETPTAGKMYGLSTIFHVLWLRRITFLITWLIVAIPTGVLLSLFNLPKSYTAQTILRFPNVVGAQTNMMRDIAINKSSSIISIFGSYQVLESTAKKLGLLIRINTTDVFRKQTFKNISYGENLSRGVYTLNFDNYRNVEVIFAPPGQNKGYRLFKGPIHANNILELKDLKLEFTESFLNTARNFKLELVMRESNRLIENMKKNLMVKALGEDNYLVSYKDSDPWMVADILNQLREDFLQIYYGTTEVQDVSILAQMEKDLDVAKSKLDKSQDELSQFYSLHPELLHRGETPSTGDNLAYLELRGERDRIKSAQQKLQNIMAAMPNSSGEDKGFWAQEMLGAMVEAGESKAGIMRASLAGLDRKENEFKASLGPTHPKITEIQKQRESIYADIQLTYNSLLRSMSQKEVDASVKASTASSGRTFRPSVKVELELDRLNTANKNNQDIYDKLQASYSRAKLTTGSEFFKVTIVDEARPAFYESPSFKNRIIIAGASVGILFFVVLAFFALSQLLFQKIWSKNDLKKFLDLKPLGSVGERKTARGYRRLTGEVDPLLLFYGKANSLEDVESFRLIREECENFFRNPEDPDKLCLIVTSTQPHDGKSTCASNLAMAFARKGKKTLLIDADFRLGRIHRIFALNVHTGIDELLSQSELNENQFLEASTLLFQTTVQKDLVIVARKASNPNAGELVSSTKFKAFVKMCREQFDVVILDTPPVMITPEPFALIEVADGVVYVCRSGHTSVSEAREGLSIMRERDIKIASILNCVQTSPFEPNRYKKYSYYYQVQPKP